VSASCDYSKPIMVGLRYSREAGLFALTSPDLPGLLLAGRDPSQLWADVPAVIKAMYRVGYGMEVEVAIDSIPESDDAFIPLRPTLAKVEPLRS
jgi:hypothetical protein